MWMDESSPLIAYSDNEIFSLSYMVSSLVAEISIDNLMPILKL
jgi:hypothetical protein